MISILKPLVFCCLSILLHTEGAQADQVCGCIMIQEVSMAVSAGVILPEY